MMVFNSKRVYRYVIIYIYDGFTFQTQIKVSVYLNIECEWTFFIALLFVWMFFIILHFLIARLTYFGFSHDVIEDMILNYTSAYFTHSSRKKSINNYWRNHDMMKHFFEMKNILLFTTKEKNCTKGGNVFILRLELRKCQLITINWILCDRQKWHGSNFIFDHVLPNTILEGILVATRVSWILW